MPSHSYATRLQWSGSTDDYRSYSRNHTVTAEGRPTLDSSSDPAFRGAADRWNPELLLVAALSQCHLLSYLHRCAVNGVVVVGYTDDADGTMAMDGDGGQFTQVTLRPDVTVADAAMIERATLLHDEAAELCFIARSVNFPVTHQPTATARTR
jgi:organic hydroperoxide reductase OsmC/OhrA